MHYYSFHIGDYRKDTAHLTTTEHYIYRSLIDWYYLDEQPIPKITQVVMRRLSLGSDSLNNLQNVLDDFFTENEKGWVHARIEADIVEYHRKSEKNKINGSLGGRPLKTQVVIAGLPAVTQPQPSRNPNHKPLTNIIKSQALSSLQANIDDQADVVLEKSKTQKQLTQKQVAEVFDYWKLVMSHEKSRLDVKRQRCITAALKIGYEPNELKLAIDGCSRTPHNMGENDRNTRFDGIHIIFKDADQIDRFIANSGHGQQKQQIKSGVRYL